MPKLGDIWYRYYDIQYAPPLDLDGRPSTLVPGSVVINLTSFKIIKLTPKGVRLDNGRFINLESNKKFAWPTREEALDSFKARKKAEIRIMQARENKAQRALRIALDTEPYLLKMKAWYA